MTERSVILLGTTWSDRKRSFLERLGANVQSVTSAGRAIRALENAKGHVLVFVNLRSGGAGPERVVAAARARALPTTVLACRDDDRSGAGRAAELGFDRVYRHPEGTFTAALETLELGMPAPLLRAAERAVINEPLEVEGQTGLLDGRIVNISATGALLELGAALDPGDELGLELTVPSTGERTPVVATVAWAETATDCVRVGVRFRNLSPEAAKALEAFVHHRNIVDVPERAAQPAGPSRTRSPGVRVQRVGDSRRDYFRIVGSLGDGATLWPRAPFFVPWQVGDELIVVATRGGTPARVKIIERVVEHEGIDSPIGWRVIRVADAAERVHPS